MHKTVYSQDISPFGNFGDSAVAPIYSQNYYSLFSTETVFSSTGIISKSPLNQ